jgi:hypothetical protein
MRPYLEKTLHEKKAGGIAQDVGPEFKSQYHKKKKKKERKINRIEFRKRTNYIKHQFSIMKM